ncbi:MAG: hypothetical protein MHMPM18_003561 [Marteilia pararefringens]
MSKFSLRYFSMTPIHFIALMHLFGVLIQFSSSGVDQVNLENLRDAMNRRDQGLMSDEEYGRIRSHFLNNARKFMTRHYRHI